MRALGILLVGLCLAVPCRAADSKDDPDYHPFTNFGKDISGYQDPKVNKPFTDFGKDLHKPTRPELPPVLDYSPKSKSKDDDDAPQGNFPPPPSVLAAEAAEAVKPTEIDPVLAKDNFRTVVETYILHAAKDGCWPVKDGATSLCVTLGAVDDSKLKKLTPWRYSNLVVLRDDAKKQTRTALVVVDYETNPWSVHSIRLATSRDTRRASKPSK